MKSKLLILALLLMASIGLFLYKQPAEVLPATTTAQAQINTDKRIDYSAITILINQRRTENGITQQLTIDQRLNTSAQLKANDMITKDYWAHNDPQGGTPWHFFIEAEYNYTKAGENLSKCYNTPETAVKAWYESPKHKDNMLSDYTDIGFGIGEYKNGCLLIVNHFGNEAL